MRLFAIEAATTAPDKPGMASADPYSCRHGSVRSSLRRGVFFLFGRMADVEDFEDGGWRKN